MITPKSVPTISDPTAASQNGTLQIDDEQSEQACADKPHVAHREIDHASGSVDEHDPNRQQADDKP